MVCEKCARDVEGIVCMGCGQTIMQLGPYCYLCGQGMEDRREAIGEEYGSDGETDFSGRILCSDGACIGVVENGVCKICGKPYVPESDQ